jgi:molecular chaperone GrpE
MPNSRASDTERDATGQPAEGSAVTGEAGARPPEGAAAPPPDLSAELAQAEDRYKRALADLDNYRKRSARDLQRRIDESTDVLLRDWLEALDSVERALRMEPETLRMEPETPRMEPETLRMEPESPLFEGLRAVLAQMDAILERQGVQRIGAAGERFDPERHEAVGVRQTTELPDRTVVEVVRSGFARGDRVLRPAQVIVSDARERNA